MSLWVIGRGSNSMIHYIAASYRFGDVSTWQPWP